MSRIANRYARALFRLADGEPKRAQEMRHFIGPILDLFRMAEAKKVLNSPVMPADLKKSLLTYALDNAKADKQTRDFVSAVLAAGRVALLPLMIQEFDRLLDAAAGRMKAVVRSAVPLGAEESKEISASLEATFKKTVELEQRVDANLLGGFVVNIGNALIDLSLKTKLEALAQSAVR